jgi:hypothetical protein
MSFVAPLGKSQMIKHRKFWLFEKILVRYGEQSYKTISYNPMPDEKM